MTLRTFILGCCAAYLTLTLSLCTLLVGGDMVDLYRRNHAQPEQTADQVFNVENPDKDTLLAIAQLKASAEMHEAQEEERRLMRPLPCTTPLTNLSPRQQIERVNAILGAAPVDLEKMDKR